MPMTWPFDDSGQREIEIQQTHVERMKWMRPLRRRRADIIILYCELSDGCTFSSCFFEEKRIHAGGL